MRRILGKKLKIPGLIQEGETLSKRIYYGTFGMVVCMMLWAAVGYGLFSMPGYEQFSGFLPFPTLQSLYGLALDGDFWFSVFTSLRRVGIGILIAFFIGLPFGLMIGFYSKLRMITHTPIQFLRMVSPLSWMPIALLVFRSFETAIYFLIAMATVWPIIINTAQGVTRVDPQWINMGKNEGANDYHLFVKIIIPSSVPYIIASLRLALGVGWIVLVPAEFLGVSSGLGYLINDARDTMAYDRLGAIVIAIGIIGFLLDGMIEILQKKLQWAWH